MLQEVQPDSDSRAGERLGKTPPRAAFGIGDVVAINAGGVLVQGAVKSIHIQPETVSYVVETDGLPCVTRAEFDAMTYEAKMRTAYTAKIID